MWNVTWARCTWGKQRSLVHLETQGRTLRKGLESSQTNGGKGAGSSPTEGGAFAKALKWWGVPWATEGWRRRQEGGTSWDREAGRHPSCRASLAGLRIFWFNRVVHVCEMAWFMFFRDLFSDHVMKESRRMMKERMGEWISWHLLNAFHLLSDTLDSDHFVQEWKLLTNTN